MSAANCRKAITDILKTYTGNPPIYAENVTIPNDVAPGEWVRWSIRMADNFDSDIGANNERAVGAIYFQHFKPENTGTTEAWAFADKVGAMFNAKSAAAPGGGSIRFARAVTHFIGTADGKVQHNITIDWRYDAPALNAA